jgi:tetratricopeptide (TPR) repeat protein
MPAAPPPMTAAVGAWAEEIKEVLAQRGAGPGGAASDEQLARIAHVVAQGEACLALNNPLQVDSLASLANWCVAHGRGAAGTQMLEQALARRRGALGELHPITGKAASKLAIVAGRLGDQARALECVDLALAAQQAAATEAQRTTQRELAETRNNKACILRALGRLEPAQALLEEALAGFVAADGAEAKHVGRAHANLATVLVARREHARAAEHFNRALAVYRRTLRPDDPEVLVLQNNLADLHYEQGDARTALGLLAEVVTAQRAQRSPEAAVTLENMGVLHLALGDPPAAVAVLAEARALFEAGPEQRPHHVVQVLGRLGLAHLRSQQWGPAEASFREALALAERTGGPTAAATAAARSHLANFLAHVGREAEARALMK